MLNSIQHGAILELRLARPPANALDPELIAALRDAVAAAPERGAKALVLSGPDGMFSAGLDVPALLALDRPALRATWQAFFGMLRNLAASKIPVAAAITGHSPAGGAVMTLYCDRRVMAEGKFRIGLNEVQVGLPLPEVIYRALVDVVGTRQANRLGAEGLLLEPAEAMRVGLVDEVVPPAEVVGRAVAWCESILKVPPGAVGATRALARAEILAAFDRMQGAALESWVDLWFSDETQAAMRALVARLAARR